MALVLLSIRQQAWPIPIKDKSVPDGSPVGYLNFVYFHQSLFFFYGFCFCVLIINFRFLLLFSLDFMALIYIVPSYPDNYLIADLWSVVLFLFNEIQARNSH